MGKPENNRFQIGEERKWGFFRKRQLCVRCGKEYQARITLGVHICDECLARGSQKKNNVKGYVDYANRMLWDSYTEEQLDAIATHRDAVLEKVREQMKLYSC